MQANTKKTLKIYDDVEILEYHAGMNFDFIKDIPDVPKVRGNRGGRIYNDAVDITCAFDIETTTLWTIEQSFMYVWQFAIGEKLCIIGHSWDDFKSMLLELKEACGQRNIICYIFNASYEFQYIKGIYKFNNDEVFALDDRKIMYFRMYDFIEFRCAYLHTNESLDKFTHEMKVKHGKISGQLFDYSKTRYPWTPLNTIEMQYIVNDVIGLVEAINIEKAGTGDTLHTLPYTKTGFVRRDARRVMENVPHELIKSSMPDFDTYSMDRRAFRGGDTHTNRYYSGLILEDMFSSDRGSSYIECICCYPAPIGEMKEVKNPTYEKMYEHVKRGRAILMDIDIEDLKLKNPLNGMPYIPKAKCGYIENGVYDNGRVLSADYIQGFTLTDVDMRILVREYDFHFHINKMKYAKYGMLPEQLRGLCIEYFKRKTALKHVEGQEFDYMMAKSQLNSIYGFMAMDPLKRTLLFDGNVFNPDMKLSDAELLKKITKKAFVSYNWAVWVTAWARYRLRQMLWAMDPEQAVYVDTDSVKHLGEVDFTSYNDDVIKRSTKWGAYADDSKGKRHYMGYAEYEGKSDRWASLGAKKYVAEKGGELVTTIAGVSKEYGGEELGKIENFKEGFTFYKSGGTESVYNDGHYGIVKIDEHEIDITSNIVIKDSTYTLGITDEYRELIRYAQFRAYNEIMGIK